jgi:hypothetical protein
MKRWQFFLAKSSNKGRFHVVKDLLEDNWAYREMVQWAEEKSFERGLKQAKKQCEQLLVRFVETRFPDLVPLAQQQIAQTTNFQQLHEIAGRLFVARTDSEAKSVLLGKQ